MCRKELNNYNEKLYRPAHEAKQKVLVMMQTGRHMVQEGHVFFEEKKKQERRDMKVMVEKYRLKKKSVPYDW